MSSNCHKRRSCPRGRGQVDRAAGTVLIFLSPGGGEIFCFLVPGGGDKACGNPVATAGTRAMRPRHAGGWRRGGTKKLFPGFGAGRERAGFMTCLPVGLPRDGRRAGIAAAPVQPAIMGPGAGAGISLRAEKRRRARPENRRGAGDKPGPGLSQSRAENLCPVSGGSPCRLRDASGSPSQ
jgi:hypothetical protein